MVDVVLDVTAEDAEIDAGAARAAEANTTRASAVRSA
jgi:hypothetical protein